jgi:hypothetical protein
VGDCVGGWVGESVSERVSESTRESSFLFYVCRGGWELRGVRARRLEFQRKAKHEAFLTFFFKAALTAKKIGKDLHFAEGQLRHLIHRFRYLLDC